jgi:hypothetical protein
VALALGRETQRHRAVAGCAGPPRCEGPGGGGGPGLSFVLSARRRALRGGPHGRGQCPFGLPIGSLPQARHAAAAHQALAAQQGDPDHRRSRAGQRPVRDDRPQRRGGPRRRQLFARSVRGAGRACGRPDTGGILVPAGRPGHRSALERPIVFCVMASPRRQASATQLSGSSVRS